MVKRYSYRERQQPLDAWQHSGLTKQHSCRQHDFNPATFYYTDSTIITMTLPQLFLQPLFLHAGLCLGITTSTR